MPATIDARYRTIPHRHDMAAEPLAVCSHRCPPSHLPVLARTVLIRKHFLNFFFADMVFVIIHSAS